MADRLVLIILIDALGYEAVGRGGFLRGLDAPRAPIRSVLGYSSANLPTIMTGRLPQEHGHFSMYRRAGRDGVFRPIRPWIRLATRLTRRRWRLSQWITQWVRARGVTGYFSLYDIPLPLLGEFDLCQRHNIYAPGAFPGLTGLADTMERAGPWRAWNWSVPEERAFAELEGEIDAARARTLFFYTPALDGLMHAAGPQSGAVRSRLEEYDRRITAILERARARYRELRVFVFGDHGMAPVHGRHDLLGGLARLGLRVPEDLLWFVDSTMARFWFHSEPARRAVESYLGGLDCGRILSDQELAELGALFPRREYGELIFLLHEGEIAVPSFMSGTPVRGMHGYHPDATHSFTTLISNVHELPYPQNLLELHELLRDEIAGAGR